MERDVGDVEGAEKLIAWLERVQDRTELFALHCFTVAQSALFTEQSLANLGLSDPPTPLKLKCLRDRTEIRTKLQIASLGCSP